MNATAFARRVSRRETHSSRAGAAVVTAIVLLLAVLWLLVGQVLSLTGHGPLWLSPAELVYKLSEAPRNAGPALLGGGGAVLAVLGLLALLLAAKPGTRSRHAAENVRAAVVVDDQVIAAAMSRTARNAAGLSAEQVSSSVGARTVDVTLHPTSGFELDPGAVHDAVARELDGYRIVRPLKLRIVVSEKGALGL